MPDTLSGQPFGVPRYPFGDEASLTTRDGLIFGAGWIVDARFYARGATDRPGLMSVVVTPAGATLVFGDGATASLASAFVATGAAPSRYVPLTTAAGALAGLIETTSALTLVTGWPVGSHPFNAGDAALAPTTVIPRPEIGLAALAVTGGSITGDVWVVGGPGTVWSIADNGGALVFNAVGDPLYKQAACPGTFTAPAPLRSINGIAPASDASFLLAAATPPEGTALRIGPTGTSSLGISVAGAE